MSIFFQLVIAHSSPSTSIVFPILSVSIVLNYVRSLLNRIRVAVVNLNLFESQAPRTPTIISRELFRTRLFLLLLITSSIAAAFYTSLVVQSQLVTVAHPSFATYQQLYKNYADTLKCPCSQQSISYGSFLNVTFILHQVCSSDLISSTWLNYLESFDPILLPSWAVTVGTRDFRSAGNAYFQLLATFCSLAKINIADAQNSFTNTRFVADHVLSPSLFIQQANAVTESYISNTQNDFQQTFAWIMIAVTGSYFLTGANTNSDVTIHGDDSIVINELFYGLVADINHEFISLRGYCTCPVQFSNCYVPSFLYTVGTAPLQYEQILWDLPIGCIPLIGFLLSTSAWWYTESYVENIRDTYSRVILSQSSPNIHAIDASLPTQYRNQTLQHLISSMFIEPPILHNVHFSSFYNQCAPSSCSYTVVQRRDLLVVLVLLISICGGLNKLLRILVRLFSKVIFFLVDWWKHRDEQHSKSTDCFAFPAFHIYFGVSLENGQKEGLEQ